MLYHCWRIPWASICEQHLLRWRWIEQLHQLQEDHHHSNHMHWNPLHWSHIRKDDNGLPRKNIFLTTFLSKLILSKLTVQTGLIISSKVKDPSLSPSSQAQKTMWRTFLTSSSLQSGIHQIKKLQITIYMYHTPLFKALSLISTFPWIVQPYSTI